MLKRFALKSSNENEELTSKKQKRCIRSSSSKRLKNRTDSLTKRMYTMSLLRVTDHTGQGEKGTIGMDVLTFLID